MENTYKFCVCILTRRPPSAHENREVNPHGARGEIYFRCSAANTKALSFFYIISPRYIFVYSFILSRPVFFNFGPPICLLGLATALLKAALRRGWCNRPLCQELFLIHLRPRRKCAHPPTNPPALTRLTWSHGEWSFLIYLRTFQLSFFILESVLQLFLQERATFCYLFSKLKTAAGPISPINEFILMSSVH